MPSDIFQCWRCKSILNGYELAKIEDGKDCPFCCTDNQVNVDNLPEDKENK